MAIAELVMPKMGESIMEATVLKWHKKVGDKVGQDETVLEIATDKVDSEVPSTAEGTITEILFKENDVVPIGTVIARIETNGQAQASIPPQPAQQQQPAPQPRADAPVEDVPFVPQTAQPTVSKGGGNRFYSPLVLNIANSEGISMSELEGIAGTGNEGRVSKKDILQYVADKKAGKTSKQPAVVSQPAPQQQTTNNEPAPAQQATSNVPSTGNYGGNVEIIEMDRMRKLIAKHMVDSKHTSPHVTSFTEADVTNMVLWREKVKKPFEKQEGTKITFTPLFIECIVRVIKRHPMINASVDGDKIIIKKDINIGMATALPSGNLIVPVIKNADMLNLVGLS
jgi:2-oxoglutarate dehydrogenase E2 component (dihydrolipoamide succinyltransferase)